MTIAARYYVILQIKQTKRFVIPMSLNSSTEIFRIQSVTISFNQRHNSIPRKLIALI